MGREFPCDENGNDGEKTRQKRIFARVSRRLCHSSDNVPKLCQKQGKKAKSNKIDKRPQRNLKHSGHGGRSLPVPDGGINAQRRYNNRPEGGDRLPYILPAGRHGSGKHVHHHMISRPLGIGNGRKNNHHHEQFRGFHRAVQRIVKKIAKKHVGKSQGDHQHEYRHACGAEQSAELLIPAGCRFERLFQAFEDISRLCDHKEPRCWPAAALRPPSLICGVSQPFFQFRYFATTEFFHSGSYCASSSRKRFSISPPGSPFSFNSCTHCSSAETINSLTLV